MSIRIISVFSLLVLEVFLTSRFILRLFAARPDNIFVENLYLLTEPFIAPLRILDQHQPVFGAVLEISTFLALVVIFAIICVLSVWHRKAITVSE